MTTNKYHVKLQVSLVMVLFIKVNVSTCRAESRALFVTHIYINILNQKRNFRKIGLRGGHTRYERKKKNRHLPQMKLKYQMKFMIFRLYMNFDELIFNHCAITNMNKNC